MTTTTPGSPAAAGGFRPTTPTAPTNARWLPRLIALGVLVGVAVLGAESTPGRLVMIVTTLVLSVKWPVQRVLVAMTILFTAADDPSTIPYNGLWTSPVQHVADFWYRTISHSVPFLPIPVAPMLVVALIVLVRAATDKTGPGLESEPTNVRHAASFGSALLAALAVVGVAAGYGYATGGQVQQVYYQVFGILIAVSVAGAAARVATPAFARLIVHVLVAAAVYRSFLAIYVYWTVARGLDEAPLYLTSHNDSILWVVALMWVTSNVIERADKTAKRIAVVLVPIIGLAIIVNNRRLAWVVFFGALAYVVLSASALAHRRLRSISGVAVPALAAYFILGLAAPPSRPFAPVQAVQSVFLGTDRSSQTRSIEDYNLVFTMRQTFPLPSGFGKPYIEAVAADDISLLFAQFQFLPHNSILGMLMLVGPVGLMLLLGPLVLGVQASHRVRQATQDPELRTLTAMVMTCWIGFLAQAWGDLGLFTALPVALAGVSAGLGMGLHDWYRTNGGLTEVLR